MSSVYDKISCSLRLSANWKSLSHVWLFATPWTSSGQNTGVGSLSLLQQIFLIQTESSGFKLGSPALQADSLPAEQLVIERTLSHTYLLIWEGLLERQEATGTPSADIDPVSSHFWKLILTQGHQCWQDHFGVLSLGFPGHSDSKESAFNAGDLDSIPSWGWLPGAGSGNPLQ